MSKIQKYLSKIEKIMCLNDQKIMIKIIIIKGNKLNSNESFLIKMVSNIYFKHVLKKFNKFKKVFHQKKR